jgi:uncharacterized protein
MCSATPPEPDNGVGSALGSIRGVKQILACTAHRPWGLPPHRWVWSQRWEALLFAHWRAPVEVVRPLIPVELQIDTFDGSAWISVVPFKMVAVRLRGMPAVPFLSTFPELNVRTYVRCGPYRGVYFLSIDARGRAVCALARSASGLPYRHARLSHLQSGSHIRVECARRSDSGADWRTTFRAAYCPTSDPFLSIPGTLDAWLTERYCLYTSGARRGSGIRRSDIHHAPWPLQHVDCTIETNSVLADVNVRVPMPCKPDCVHYSKGVHIVAWPFWNLDPS